MEVTEFINKRGESRYMVVVKVKSSTGFITKYFHANGFGYKSPEGAIKGYHAEISKEIRLRYKIKWEDFKLTKQGQIFLSKLKGNKLTYKLLDTIKQELGVMSEISTPRLYNIIKEETNKDCCYE